MEFTAAKVIAIVSFLTRQDFSARFFHATANQVIACIATRACQVPLERAVYIFMAKEPQEDCVLCNRIISLTPAFKNLVERA